MRKNVIRGITFFCLFTTEAQSYFKSTFLTFSSKLSIFLKTFQHLNQLVDFSCLLILEFRYHLNQTLKSEQAHTRWF